MSVSAPHDADPSAHPKGDEPTRLKGAEPTEQSSDGPKQGSDTSSSPATEQTGALTEDEEALSRRRLLGIGGGLLAGFVFGGVAFNALQQPRNNPNGIPTPEETKSSATPEQRWIPEKGDYLSQDILADCETPEQITDLSTFHEGDFNTIEGYTRLWVYRNGAFINAGTTLPEWAPYASDDGSLVSDYVEAQHTKYDNPMREGMFGTSGLIDSFADNSRAIRLNRAAESFSLVPSRDGKKLGAVEYTVDYSLDKIVSSSGSVESGLFTVAFIVKAKDNLEESMLRKVYGDTLEGLSEKFLVTRTVELRNGEWADTKGDTKVETQK